MKISSLHLRWACLLVLAAERVTATFVLTPFQIRGEKIALTTNYKIPLSRLLLVADNKEQEEWAMEEDWALLDQIPRFTVIGEDERSTQTRTFWTQLCAATPILAKREPSDLYQRCQELAEQQQQHAEEKELLQGRRSLVYGPSPPLLENWQIDLHRLDGKVVGQTDDGRTIWLRYHCIGRLQGDPFSDLSPSLLSLLPGGYLEAVGGRVYELGQPRLLQQASHEQKEVHNTPLSSSFLIVNHHHEHEANKNYVGWWLPVTTATMSALLASTVLSACIGYGAGLAIISDQGIYSPSSTGGPQTATTASIRNRNPKVQMNSQPSIAEQRARAEACVLREHRLLHTFTERLEIDQKYLNSLIQQEQQQ
jgi:hypothetical protein